MLWTSQLEWCGVPIVFNMWIFWLDWDYQKTHSIFQNILKMNRFLLPTKTTGLFCVWMDQFLWFTVQWPDVHQCLKMSTVPGRNSAEFQSVLHCLGMAPDSQCLTNVLRISAASWKLFHVLSQCLAEPPIFTSWQLSHKQSPETCCLQLEFGRMDDSN